MIIRFHQIESANRDDVRFLENKGHTAYIRYLLLRRTPFLEINDELSRLGLSGASDKQYTAYFDEVLHPLISKYGLSRYYKRYKLKRKDDSLSFASTFRGEDNHRIQFCELIKEVEADPFFGREIANYYGSNNIPINTDGKPILIVAKEDWTEILLNDKKYVIDGMIAEGHSSKSISNHLELMYDMKLSAPSIDYYMKSFMNIKRKDMETVISKIEDEKETIQKQMEYIRENQDSFTIGERLNAISKLKAKGEELDAQLKNLRSAHSSSAYSQGILEYSNMREIFAAVMTRTHRRYRVMDDRTEDAIVDPLMKLTNMMAKSMDKVVELDAIMSETTQKSISEEMLEVVMPTLDRVEEEEREAMEKYKVAFAYEESEEEDILGFDE